MKRPYKEWLLNLPFEVEIIRSGFIKRYGSTLTNKFSDARKFLFEEALLERDRLDQMFGRWICIPPEQQVRRDYRVPTLEEIKMFEVMDE